MRAQHILIAALGLSTATAWSCNKEDQTAQPAVEAVNPADKAAPTDLKSESAGQEVETQQGIQRLGEKPAEVLLDAALERRLYSDRVEASSFLWVNYNRFQENYHPNYIMDGDPSTAWIEGAQGNGIGEWIRIKTSPVSDSSLLRLVLKNGYHKSAKLFAQNARALEVEVSIRPSGTQKVFALADSMDSQELVMALAGERFEGIEIKILSALDGSKYEDLCLSDVEIYVTGRTPDNPAFEAKKLEQIKAWKQSRLDAAKIFASASAKELPIHSGYRVREDAKVGEVDLEGPHAQVRGTIALLKASSGGDAALFQRAEAALAQDFKDWTLQSIAVKNPIGIPDVDGLETQTAETLVYGWPSDAFVLPAIKGRSLLQNKRISLLQVKQRDFDPRHADSCKTNQVYAMRPPGAVGPDASELLVWRCVEEEEREGVYTYLAWELYEFDEEGWLRLAIGSNRAQYLDWQMGERGIVLEGGLRLESWEHKLSRLIAKQAAE